MKTTYRNTLIAAAVSAALLAGCSGGSGSSGVAVNPVTNTGTTTGTDTTTGVGVFIDALVSGLSYESGAGAGLTNDKGEFSYVVNGQVQFKVGSKVNLGSTTGKRQVTPLDLVPASADDRIVKAIASLLQSLDTDGNHSNGITITPAIIAMLDEALGESAIDFTTWDEMSDEDLAAAMASLANVLLAVDAAADEDPTDDIDPVYVDPDAAGTELLANLVQENLYQKNISKTPEHNTDKVGIDILDITVPAMSADGTPLTNTDGLSYDVNPLLTNYADGGLNGERVWDPYVAVSYDNGMTWKRTNLFRKAGKEFSLNGMTFHAKSGGPSMQINGNHIVVSWISTFCQGGPSSVVSVDETTTGIDQSVPNPAAVLLGDLDTSDSTVTDWFKVLGKQGTVTYYFDNGTTLTNPYYCVWAARGVVNEAAVADDDGTIDYITWYAPEQLTSGVRDAKLDWPAGVSGIGFGLVWQEDPEGLLPGEGEGPGVGWSGATTHHKTDIWYSYLDEAMFAATVEEEDVDGVTRPKPLNKFSVPVPLTNNNSCRTDSNGTIPAYCDTSLVPSTPFCVETQQVTIKLGSGTTDTGTFCVTTWGDVLDGDTGASRPNMHWAATHDESGILTGARALVTYEETKGLCEEGHGCPDAPYDVGKFVMYHHMPTFLDPHIVRNGDILSTPVKMATTDPLDPAAAYVPTDDATTTDVDESQLWENARRERFVINSDPTHDVKLVVIYKQGWYNQGERADIFARRLVGGWEIENFSPAMCASCVMPTETELTDTSSGTATTKVTAWDWQTDYVDHESWTNPYDDARSLRAKLDGDRLLIAYGWTPNWLLSTVLGGDGYFKDNFDFMLRRSFNVDSGYTINGDTVTFAAEGANQAIFFEPPINTSNLANNQVNQVEPRLVTVPGSIMICGEFGIGVDQDPSSCLIPSGAAAGSDKFVVTYCTAENTEREGPDGRPIHAPGLDCFFSWTVDNGETFVAKDTDGDGDIDFDCIACEKDLEEVEPEVVLTEDGMTMHVGWAANGELDATSSDIQNGSDAWYGQWQLQPEEEPVEEPTL